MRFWRAFGKRTQKLWMLQTKKSQKKTDKQAETQTDQWADRQTDRQVDTQTDRKKNRQTDRRQAGRQTDIETEGERKMFGKGRSERRMEKNQQAISERVRNL